MKMIREMLNWWAGIWLLFGLLAWVADGVAEWLGIEESDKRKSKDAS